MVVNIHARFGLPTMGTLEDTACDAAAAADDAAVEGDSDEDRFSTPNGRVWTMGLLLDDGEST